MSKGRVLSRDPDTLKESRFHYDEATGEFGIEAIQDVQPVVELNRAEFKEFDAKAPWKGDLHKVASIPTVIWYELVRKGIAQDEKALLKWIEDRDNEAFRTRPGRLMKKGPILWSPDKTKTEKKEESPALPLLKAE